jgi:hypothetical protein
MILQPLGIWLSARAQSTVRKQVLMTDCYPLAHHIVGNCLTACSRGLMLRSRIVFIRRPGLCFLCDNDRLITDVLEHL